jgi:hypothetical protein
MISFWKWLILLGRIRLESGSEFGVCERQGMFDILVSRML